MLKLKKFERYPLTFGPTPIEQLPRMSAALGDKVQINAKRDDCNSGLALGGNKLRKLEYIIPDAIASGADTLVAIGGVQSNHTRMVAATAANRKVFLSAHPCISMTGSTQAGMIVGFADDDRADRVIGIDASGTPEQTRTQVHEIVDKTAELVELGRPVCSMASSIENGIACRFRRFFRSGIFFPDCLFPDHQSRP